MLTKRTLQLAVERGLLMQLRPRVRRDPVLRHLYLSADLDDSIRQSLQQAGFVERYAALLADLEVFVSSPTIAPTYLWGLAPPPRGVWEIRSREPEPQLRVFCLFLTRDCLVATHLVTRDGMGQFSDPAWKYEMNLARRKFRNIFPGFTPLASKDSNKLFSGALNARYFRD